MRASGRCDLLPFSYGFNTISRPILDHFDAQGDLAAASNPETGMTIPFEDLMRGSHVLHI